MLYEGRRVVCVDATGWPQHIVNGVNPPILPEEGVVYTIRAIIPGREYGWPTDGALLMEIVNPGTHATIDRVVFRATRFRPLTPTNIDSFKSLLVEQPVR